MTVTTACRTGSYRATRSAGHGWALVGDAFGFLDPLYSSGILLALKSGEMAAKMRSESGQVIELVNGDRLDFMRTGSSGLWRDVLVDFRPYTMTIRSPAELWDIERNGERFEAILPRVCNNLADRRTSRPRP